jgi:hypothetical protein
VTESGYSCARCKEKLVVIMYYTKTTTGFGLLIRPRRVSKCANYKPGGSRICGAERVTKEEALENFRVPGHGGRREVVKDG